MHNHSLYFFYILKAWVTFFNPCGQNKFVIPLVTVATAPCAVRQPFSTLFMLLVVTFQFLYIDIYFFPPLSSYHETSYSLLSRMDGLLNGPLCFTYKKGHRKWPRETKIIQNLFFRQDHQDESKGDFIVDLIVVYKKHLCLFSGIFLLCHVHAWKGWHGEKSSKVFRFHSPKIMSIWLNP